MMKIACSLPVTVQRHLQGGDRGVAIRSDRRFGERGGGVGGFGNGRSQGAGGGAGGGSGSGSGGWSLGRSYRLGGGGGTGGGQGGGVGYGRSQTRSSSGSVTLAFKEWLQQQETSSVYGLENQVPGHLEGRTGGHISFDAWQQRQQQMNSSMHEQTRNIIRNV